MFLIKFEVADVSGVISFCIAIILLKKSTDFVFHSTEIFKQQEVEDLIRDLGLSKGKAKLLTSRLKE